MGEMNRDQSMEDILASIKRVIETDGRAALATRAGRADEPADDVLELSDPVSDADAIMSDDRAEASRNALAALAAVNHAEPSDLPAAGPSEGPLEAVVREMLRPILKQWLDERLPIMVEELVTREIARITGKRL